MALILAVPRRLAKDARVLTDKPGNGPDGRRHGCSGAAFTASASALSAWAASAPPLPAAPRLSDCRSTITTASRQPATEDELEATYWESLDQMLARVDIVSVNCPSTPATFTCSRPAGWRCCSRPPIWSIRRAATYIDEAALIKSLREGKLAGAGLDVFENEPAVNPKLIKLANEGKVVLLPHMSSATIEGRIDMGDKVIINIRTFIDGHRPPNRVLPGQFRFCNADRTACLRISSDLRISIEVGLKKPGWQFSAVFDEAPLREKTDGFPSSSMRVSSLRQAARRRPRRLPRRQQSCRPMPLP
jgi:glyoxylate reductase